MNSIFLSSIIVFLNVHGYPFEKELHEYIFANYSKHVFPSDTVGQPVNVSIEAGMNYIISLDEKTQLLTSDLQLTITWKDHTMVWNENEFGGIKDILVPVSQMWIPDLAIQNALTDRRRLAKDDQIVSIKSDGTIEWTADYVGQSLCPLNMTDYPFDSQTCALFIESLSHGNDKVMIVAISAPSIKAVFPNGQWELLTTFSELSREITGDSVALVSLHMRRRVNYYLISTVIPIVVTSCLNPFVFLLPAESGEKVALSTAMLLFYSVMLTYIFDNIPSNSLSMPLIGMFVGGQLVLSALSVVCTVGMLHFRHSVSRRKQMTKKSKENEVQHEQNTTLHEKTEKLFRQLNAVLFGVFSFAEVTICLTILIIIN